MGLLPDDYYRMSPLEFYYASTGFMDGYWGEWDMVRHIMYTIASTIPSKKKLPKMRFWFPLPSDGVLKGESDIKSMFERLKKKLESHGRK